jgi:hypothetical protein
MKKELTQKIEWDIQTEELYLNPFTTTNKVAILRNDHHNLLGMVSKEYCPITNQQLMRFANALSETGEFELKGYDEFNGGKTLLAFLQNKNLHLSLNGCGMREYLIIGNSHDGTKPFYIGTGSTLIRCENQFSSSLEVFSKKHIAPFVLNGNFIQTLIKNYKIKKSNLYGVFDGMESVRVDAGIVNRLVKEVYTMLASDSTLAKKKEWTSSPSMRTLHQSIEKEMKDLGNNAFGLFNGITWYTTHEMRNAGSSFGLLDGTANLINQKAFRFCSQLKRVSQM